MTDLKQVMRIADREGGGGLIYIHPGDSPPTHALLTIDRLNSLIDRIFPGGIIPEDDPQWNHEHYEIGEEDG